ALEVIPVEGSIIVTNDLRYPADQYARDFKQFQIAALFGHQAYASVTANYERSRDASIRITEQRLLRGSTWTAELSAVACQRGWTHVLLFKRSPHVEDVPGRRLYDSPSYTTYALRDCSLGRQPMVGTGKK